MGEFRDELWEKIKKHNEKEQERLTIFEQLECKRAELENALVFLEKTGEEAQEGWYINSCKELSGKGILGKLGVVRRKLQRKLLHWYMEPVCDDQSVYNRKLLRAITAMEDFASTQAEWNRIMQEAYEAECKELKAQIALLKAESESGKKDRESGKPEVSVHEG